MYKFIPAIIPAVMPAVILSIGIIIYAYDFDGGHFNLAEFIMLIVAWLATSIWAYRLKDNQADTSEQIKFSMKPWN